MQIVMGILTTIGMVLLAILIAIVSYIILRIIVTITKTINQSIKEKTNFKKNLGYNILYSNYGQLYDFIKWVIYDIIQGKDRFKLFGIWAFTGYYGQGKTIGAVTFANQLKKMNPQKNIKIYTNFNMEGQDGKVEKWQDLLELPPDTILIFDEIQSTFSSQKFKDFPLELLWKLTQCRKHGLMIFASTPVFSRMVIQLRESVDFVITCKNRFKMDRWFSYNFYHAPEYEKWHLEDDMLKKFVMNTYSFIATNNHYNQYNTKETVDRMEIEGEETPKKGKSVITRNEIDKMIEQKIKELESRINTKIK